VLGYALRRLAVTVPLLVVVALACFALSTRLPADPSVTRMEKHRTAEAVEAYRRRLGLDDPFLVRFGRFLSGAVRLDFGEDWVRPGVRVSEELSDRFPKTVELTVLAMLVATTVGVFVGVRSAARPRGGWNALGQTAALLGTSVPVFWLGMMGMLLFTVSLGWLPAPDWTPRAIAPRTPFSTRFFLFESLLRGDLAAAGRALRNAALPALALSTIPLAVVVRMTRSSMLEELGRDYVRTARAKGVPERGVVSRHAFRNALVPVVTATGLQTGALLGGAVLTETVFGWPGVGTYLVNAVRSGNTPGIVGGVVLVATVFVLGNLVVDLLTHAIDPRLRRAS
jgi:peptide/nickel transport system permease protein